MNQRAAPVSVIVPAHNESAGIGRLLGLLTTESSEGEVEVIVACNSCTDETADTARAYEGVVVVEIPEASKWLALEAGNVVARHAVRAYVDADVAISRHDLMTLVSALTDGVLAAGPERRLSLETAAWGVRWYYDVWQRLPQVRSGLFGRGMIVLSPEGHERVRGLPMVMSDDLAISEAFAPSERAIVPSAVVVIECPRTLRDLIRRRERIATGNSQADQLGLRSRVARTSLTDLLKIAAESPALAAKVGVFVAVTSAGRLRARRRVRQGDFTTWLRDESTRG
jgi:cellulose synthase/poly-beta-1,6-N-acetylglucosamine synthase-like glycosyltransferase